MSPEAIALGAPAWIANAATAVFWYAIIIRWRLLPDWPLDGGIRFRGRRLFGNSRNLFGAIFMVLCGGFVGLLQGDPYFGLLLGALALLGTLINSFVKRRLGIRPGARFFIDHIDYALAVVIGLALLDMTPPDFDPVIFIAWVFVFQVTINALAACFGLRSGAIHDTRA